MIGEERKGKEENGMVMEWKRHVWSLEGEGEVKDFTVCLRNKSMDLNRKTNVQNQMQPTPYNNNIFF